MLRSRSCNACGKSIPDIGERVEVRFEGRRLRRHFHRVCWDIVERSVETAALSVDLIIGAELFVLDEERPSGEGTAGVREPRRPLPPNPRAGAVAVDPDEPQ